MTSVTAASVAPDRSAPPVKRPTRRLRLIGVLAAIAIVLAASAYLIWPQRIRQPTLPTLAVLPFKAVAPGDDDPSLRYGMANTLISRLQLLEGVVVQPFSSVRRYGNPEQEPLSAARELGVSAVLDGTIQRDDDRLRVTARLVNVADKRQLWAQDFHEDFTDIFTVQDTIAAKVADALAIRLTPQGQQRLSRRYTDDAQAYQLY